MPLTLHFGVIDVPYAQAPGAKPRAGRFETTGDVAEHLEREYDIMQHFYDWHGQQVADALHDGLVGTLESYAMGAPVRLDPFTTGVSKIEDEFKTFLSLKEMDMRVPGVPTMAAQRGVSHRFKNPTKRRAPRPSFVDTGLFESSMRAWVD